MKVLIATDGSPWSEAAIREAARLLPLRDAEVHVVCVADLMPLVAAFEPSPVASVQVIDQAIASAHFSADHAVALLAELGIRATAHEREGEPAIEILAVGRELEVDLLVLGSHGKNGLERFFFGSISDAVAHGWGGALLIVRPPARTAA